jgi:hypothetical protein
MACLKRIPHPVIQAWRGSDALGDKAIIFIIIGRSPTLHTIPQLIHLGGRILGPMKTGKVYSLGGD